MVSVKRPDPSSRPSPKQIKNSLVFSQLNLLGILLNLVQLKSCRTLLIELIMQLEHKTETGYS